MASILRSWKSCRRRFPARHRPRRCCRDGRGLRAGARRGGRDTAGPCCAPIPTWRWCARGVREFCAGALAARYEALGGSVLYVGKPHPASTGPASRISARSPGRASWRSAIPCARTWPAPPASASTPCWCWVAFMPRSWLGPPIRTPIRPSWRPLAPRPANGRHMRFPHSPGNWGLASAERHPPRRDCRRCGRDGRQDNL